MIGISDPQDDRRIAAGASDSRSEHETSEKTVGVNSDGVRYSFRL